MSKRSDDYRRQYLKHNKGFLGLYFCAYCLKPVTKKNMEVDHILPVSKSGINHRGNLVCSCSKCNRSKSDKIDHRVVQGFIYKYGTAILAIIFAIVLWALKGMLKIVISTLTIVISTLTPKKRTPKLILTSIALFLVAMFVYLRV